MRHDNRWARWLCGCVLLASAWAAAQAQQQQSGVQQQQQQQPLVGRRRPCEAACYQWATCNEELGRCDCPKNRTGPSCEGRASAARMRYFVQTSQQEAADPLQCMNDCNGRGSCVLGGCVCNRGHYGSDCSLSIGPDGAPAVLAGTGYRPRERRPHIYVYDIPHKYSSWFHPRKMDRGLHWLLWQRMLGAGVLVADGDQADWFYIPVKLRSTSDGPRLQSVIKYVRAHWPWWDRYQGHRHFIYHSGDSGRGEVTQAARRAAENVTWLHHWGLTADFPYSGWKAAHRPGQDLVIPCLLTPRQAHTLLPLSPLHPRAPRVPRNGTLLFAGRICGDASQPSPARPWPHCRTGRSRGYSQGVRQMVHFHHHNRSGFRVVTQDPTYPLDLMTYKWCLAPSGGGHGHRQVLVALMGCLPLILSDNVSQPFEPEMDWDAFSLRLPHAAIPELHARLAAVPAAAYEQRQAAARCAAQHLAYSSLAGALLQEDGRYDAFEFILEVLRMRLAHPHVPPSQYASADARFRAFLACGEAYDSMAAYGRAAAAAAARGDGSAGATIGPDPANDTAVLDALYRGGIWRMVRKAAATPAHATVPGASAGGGGGGGDSSSSAGEGIGGQEGAQAQQRGAHGPGTQGEEVGARGGQLRLCSASLWDPPAEQCGALWGKRLYGLAACARQRADLSTCPRLGGP